MPVRQLVSHPAVVENTGRVALARGPVVYCLESAEPHPEHLRIAKESAFERIEMDGMVGLRFAAIHAPPDEAWGSALYLSRGEVNSPPKSDNHLVTAIPYYAWANGEPRPMRVWLRTL